MLIQEELNLPFADGEIVIVNLKLQGIISVSKIMLCFGYSYICIFDLFWAILRL